MFKYRIYGLNVISEMALRCYPCSFSTEDLIIRFTQNMSEFSVFRAALRPEVPSFVLNIRDGSGSICYNGEKNIVVYYRNDDDLERSVIHFLMGTAFGYLFFLRKIFVLHGSCVAFGNKAAVFTGNSGAGKSSIAAGLTQCGGKILTDDISRVELDSEFPFVYPSFPTHKLWLHTVGQLGITEPVAAGIKGEKDKNIYYDHDQSGTFSEALVPVTAIINLRATQSAGVELVKENVKNSLTIIRDNIFNNYVDYFPNLTNDLFRYILDICDRISVFSLRRPEGLFTVREQVDIVMKNVFHEACNL